jgi:hypothetical protein
MSTRRPEAGRSTPVADLVSILITPEIRSVKYLKLRASTIKDPAKARMMHLFDERAGGL